jgi:YVTN family beta-propeller protein
MMNLQSENEIKSSMAYKMSWIALVISVVGVWDCWAADPYLSPSALVIDQDSATLYIAETTARRVAVFDMKSKTVRQHIPLPLEPTGLALSAEKSALYVTAGLDFGQMQIIDTANGKIVGQIEAGHGPMSPVLSKDGTRLYVCSQFENSVAVIDLAGQKQVASIPVKRQPVAAALTPDGTKLFVTNLIPSGFANDHYNAAAVSVIDAENNRLMTHVQLPNGTINVRGICVSPDGKYVYATCVLARYHLPTTQLDRGWINTNALVVIDAASNTFVNTVLLDDVDLGAANPWAVTCVREDGPAGRSYICVTHSGTHELSVIDRAAMHDKLSRIAGGQQVSGVSTVPQQVPNDLSFLTGIRKRIPLTGNGPRALAADGSDVYIAEYFSGSLGIVNVDSQAPGPVVQSVNLGNEPEMTGARKGEMLFNDASLCFQKWQSCATCHPSHGRVDGINWDLLNDGIGNPKQTKSLLYSHRTAPAMISGIRPDAETAVRAGIRYIQFTERPEEEAAAIDAYLKSLEPVASPYLKKAAGGKTYLSASAQRGKALFTMADCAGCHSGRFYTDQKKHAIGLAAGNERGPAFDTPALVEIWRTAPYLYDGRAATIQEMLTKFNPNDMHGATSDLTEEQIRDLAAYVLSL